MKRMEAASASKADQMLTYFLLLFLFQPFRNQAGTMIWFWKLSLLIEQIILSASLRFEFRAQLLSSNEYPESLSVVYVQFKNGYDVEYWLALLLSTGYTRVKVGM